MHGKAKPKPPLALRTSATENHSPVASEQIRDSSPPSLQPRNMKAACQIISVVTFCRAFLYLSLFFFSRCHVTPTPLGGSSGLPPSMDTFLLWSTKEGQTPWGEVMFWWFVCCLLLNSAVWRPHIPLVLWLLIGDFSHVLVLTGLQWHSFSSVI